MVLVGLMFPYMVYAFTILASPNAYYALII